MKSIKLFIAMTLIMCSFCNILNAQTNSNRVNADQYLGTGNLEIVSKNGKYYAKYSEGYIKISIKMGNEPFHAFNTFYSYFVGGNGYSQESTFTVLNNGNMAVISPVGGREIWTSETKGRGGHTTCLIMQNDGNLVLYNAISIGSEDGTPLWASGTCGGVKDGCGQTGIR